MILKVISEACRCIYMIQYAMCMSISDRDTQIIENLLDLYIILSPLYIYIFLCERFSFENVSFGSLLSPLYIHVFQCMVYLPTFGQFTYIERLGLLHEIIS